MSKVVREDIDSLHAVLSFTLSKEDYSDKFKKELETYRKKVNLKGFRKGKTPMSFVRKMYGQGVLAETVTGMLQNEVSKYLEENKIRNWNRLYSIKRTTFNFYPFSIRCRLIINIGYNGFCLIM